MTSSPEEPNPKEISGAAHVSRHIPDEDTQSLTPAAPCETDTLQQLNPSLPLHISADSSVKLTPRMSKSFRLKVTTSYSELKLAELDISKPSQVTSRRFPLLAELHISPFTVTDEHFSFRIGIKELRLELERENCDIVPGTRFGELDKQASRRSEVKIREDSERETEAGLQGEMQMAATIPVKISAGGKIRSTTKRIEQLEDIRTDEHRRVIVDAFSWTFKMTPDDREPFLRGRYLQPDNQLCDVEALDDDFSILARLYFEIRSGNIYIDQISSADIDGIFGSIIEKWNNQINRNRERAIQLVAARSLKKNGVECLLSEHKIQPIWYDIDEER